jgi:hypothetical protein
MRETDAPNAENGVGLFARHQRQWRRRSVHAHHTYCVFVFVCSFGARKISIGSVFQTHSLASTNGNAGKTFILSNRISVKCNLTIKQQYLVKRPGGMRL